MCDGTKFQQNRPDGFGLSQFFDSQDGCFEISKFLINRQIGGLMCIVIPYFTKIVAEISHLTIFIMTAVRHLGFLKVLSF